MVRKSQSSMIRYLLGGSLAFGALNAFGGGYYGVAVTLVVAAPLLLTLEPDLPVAGTDRRERWYEKSCSSAVSSPRSCT
jgi:hypothetical protein